MMLNLAYIRTSTAEQEPELQLRDIISIANGVKLTVLKEQVSAWKNDAKRPVFDKCVSLIKTGRVESLYCWDLDRLFRSRVKLKEFFILCKVYHTKIHSVNQQWLETLNSIPAPFNEIVFDMLINVFGWIGEEESQKKSVRVKLAVRKIAGERTMSYKGNRWGRKPLPPQTITRVMDLYKSGKSIRAIAEQVIIYDTNNNGKNISKSAVHKIIVQNVEEKHS